MARLVALLSLAAACSLPLWIPRRAEACGACFAPIETVTTVDSHRMAVSLSPERSILWDQIQYEGNPEDFVWVLPVPSPKVVVEVAESEFFDELEYWTQPRVIPKSPPMQPCFGCCAAGAAEGGYAPDDVIVYNTDVVGPYETVTIGSEDAGALQSWLVDHGYQVDESAVPTIMHYVDQKSVFVVLRLAPGEGVQSMQPVRVSYPGFLSTFPLEMVKVGARQTLDLTLWVFAEQRYAPQNYANVTVKDKDLTFDWDTQQSNYPEAFRDALDRAGGRAWVTEFAGPADRYWFSSPTEIDQVFADLKAPYLTRLRTSMLLDYLDEDVVLGPAQSAAPVSRDHQPGRELNRPYGDQKSGCSFEGRPRAHVALLAFLLASCAFLWRPRRRRRHSGVEQGATKHSASGRSDSGNGGHVSPCARSIDQV